MRIISILILSQMLLFVTGGCCLESKTEAVDSAKNAYGNVSPESCFENHKDSFDELKNLALEQEGLFNIRRTEDSIAEAVSRESKDVNIDTTRIEDLMDELELEIVYVRPEEEYFGFEEPVEFLTSLPHTSADICYSNGIVPKYSWETDCMWVALGDGWYYWFNEQT